MKQWVELESTRAWKETFGNQSENKLTTKDVGLDDEENGGSIDPNLPRCA